MTLQILLFLLLAGRALAQDPTPLRVQLSDPPARVRAESSLQGAVDMVSTEWARSAARLAAEVGLERPASVEIVLLSERTFRRWSRGLIPEWGAGYASWPEGPIVLAVGGQGPKTLEDVLRHEISHIYLWQRAPRAGLPSWFLEGAAQWQSGEWRFQDTVSMVRAANSGGLPTLSEIGGRFPSGGAPARLAYQVSLYAVNDLMGRLDVEFPLKQVLDQVVARGRFDLAFRDVFGMTHLAYSQALSDRMRARYGWILVLSNATSLFTLGALALVLGALRAGVKKRRRMAEMEREESALDAAESAQEPG